MKFISRLKRIGNSHWILVPSDVVEDMSLATLSKVSVDLEDLSRELPATSYKCRACETYFDSSDDNPYCPSCESENLVEIGEIHN